MEEKKSRPYAFSKMAVRESAVNICAPVPVVFLRSKIQMCSWVLILAIHRSSAEHLENNQNTWTLLKWG